MSSKKYEKATSFWKTSSISALPGRPNQTTSNHSSGGGAVSSSSSSAASSQGARKLTGGGGGAVRVMGGGASASSKDKAHQGPAASYKDFQASINDAWEADDGDLGAAAVAVAAMDLGRGSSPTVPPPAGPPAPAHAATPASPARKAQASVPALPSSSSSPSSTLAHSSSAINGRKTSSSDSPGCASKQEKLERLLESANIDLDQLRQLSWNGLPRHGRSKAWKILCGYLPGTTLRQGEIVQRKQDEYQQYVEQYFRTKDNDIHQETYRQIHIDIPRMSPVIGLFQQRCVQEIFERILYIWAIRHPASGYVQGINDLVTPFFLVFLQDQCRGRDLAELDVARDLTPDQIAAIEADSFWCLTKVLDGIQDNYTFAQPGIQLKVKQLEELVERVDGELHRHLVAHEVMYLQFAFRWMNNILMRELPIKATIRLWDTYLSEEGDGFSRFHLYVCAAFLCRWKEELLKKTDFHTLLMFLQNLPTAKWGDAEINLLVAEAFRLSYLFADAPKHLTHKVQ